MLWGYVQLDDGTQFAHSETRDDGTVRVAVERPADFGFDRVRWVKRSVYLQACRTAISRTGGGIMLRVLVLDSVFCSFR